MASAHDDGVDSFGASLFEGMVLFDPSSDLSPSSPPPPPLAIPHHRRPSRTFSPVGIRCASPPPSFSLIIDGLRLATPLDEDLFSDLMLLTPSSPLTFDPPAVFDVPRSIEATAAVAEAGAVRNAIASEVESTSVTVIQSVGHPPARQISRKKKRAVRVGYAREVPASNPPSTTIGTAIREADRSTLQGEVLNHYDRHDSSAIPSPSLPVERTTQTPKVELERQEDHSTVDADLDHDGRLGQHHLREDEADGNLEVGEDVNALPIRVIGNDISIKEEPEEKVIKLSTEAIAQKEDAFVLTEGNLELIRAQICENLDQIREMGSSVSAKRKELARRRRKVAEDVNSASTRYMDLERELEEACEAEDFERAERVSDSLADVEKQKDKLHTMLREAEADCYAVDSRMQEILEMQIAAEEEGANLLEQFAKDAAADADSILTKTEEFSPKEMDEWQQSSEKLETRKMEIDIEMCLIKEARCEMEKSLDHLVQDDKKEKEILCKKQDVLAKELEDLLELVRMKELEIAENNFKIKEIEKKISSVMNKSLEAQSSVDVRYDHLQADLITIKSEGEALSMKKKYIDDHLTAAEIKRSKLKELSCIADDEAKRCHDLVALRKTLASPILKSRDDIIKLAGTEEKISGEIQILREQISAARSSLQELSSNRSTVQEEIAALKQRISFIDKRCPELEGEKKVAAAARNFKEAGRMAAEAKALGSEKETVQVKFEGALSNLDNIEGEIQDTLNKVQESEGLIVAKEKEAARAGCQRLGLVAAAARAERFAALALGNTEEGDISLREAEAADSKAKELAKTYDLDLEELGEASAEYFSISLLTNLSGKRLALLASSLDIPAGSE